MKVINLFGEAGSGKSVTASGLHYLLSTMGYRAEIANEVAKSYAWESPKNPITGIVEEHPILLQQVLLLGEQNRNLERLRGKVDFIIAECPLPLGIAYAPKNYHSHFTPLTMEMFNSYDNINILLERSHNYDHSGRIQDEKEACNVRNKIIEVMKQNKIDYVLFQTNKNIHKQIAEYILNIT